MPFYIQRGKIPPKRHTTFYREDGELYREELFSTHGFSNSYSNKYHHNMPTKVLSVEPLKLEHVDDLIKVSKDGEAWKLWYTTVPTPEEVEGYVVFPYYRWST